MTNEPLPAQGPVDVTVSHPPITPMDYEPFDGDAGGPGDRVFSDSMVKARKQYECFHCGGGIVIGELHRSRYEKSDGEMMKFRWCAECCAAMVAEVEAEYSENEMEDLYPFTHRHNLKRANAK